MHIVRRLVALAALGLTVALTATALAAGTAAAGTVAPDAEEAVRSIVFPVAGPNTYSDTFGACRSGCTRGHEGTDIMTPKLTPLVAARDATVTWLKDTATPDGSQGNYVMLRDAEGWEYWYIHVNNDSPGTDDGANPRQWIFGPGIQRGARVEAGQLVAFAGDSGNAERTGSHLHFEIHKPDGSIINPYRSLRAAPRLASPLVVAGGSTAPDEAFVRALFDDFLDRSPSDVELAAKRAELAAGRSRAAVVDGFAGSDQWIQALVDGFYRSTLGREGDAGGRAHWIDVIRAGRTPASVAADFYASDEYHQRVGGTDPAWIADLYVELLHRTADEGGLQYWVGQLAAGAPRHRVALSFYQSLESRMTRVSGLYQALLGRDPDRGGQAHWAGVLADGRDLRLATFLASSDEYLQRARTRF
ncbi:MAG TPA: DUF4214 domain-containing protein [Acidimicrobiales bacterium]|nr:DUF4214 domain-containing protein [Acidimicrobiales bacterium]